MIFYETKLNLKKFEQSEEFQNAVYILLNKYEDENVY